MRRAMCALLLLCGPARAQTFPADDRFVPLRCQDRNLFDPLRDQPGAVGERDLVGDQANPAGFHAADSQFLYLRMRLDADPAPGASPRPFAWGFAFDTDDDATDYEALLILDGQSGQIALHRNTTTTVANSPADPADQPPLSTGTFAQRGRSVGVASMFGGSADAFLDLAVSWADLSAVGIGPDTPVRVWVGTSTNADRLDDDIACQDGSGGAARLQDSVSREAPLDPNAPPNPDGGVMPGQMRVVEGGPGCSAVPGGAGISPLVLLLGLALFRRKDRG